MNQSKYRVKTERIRDSYTHDVPVIIRPKLNGHGDDSCPRCVDGQLVRDDNDIACFSCGWRESAYLPGDKTSSDA